MMREDGDIQLLEASFIELDPLMEGFSGVFAEIRRERAPDSGELYFAVLFSAATGDRVFSFESASRQLAEETLRREVQGPSPKPS
ncbi:MAG: hypothetical protein H0U65_05335 [Rubrobacter sp.]|jgi:hypothetical protein|nr:hypothetical protein [Rubrobacter sp.]